MHIHAIQTGTVQVKKRQRQGQGGPLRLLNTLFDPNWTEPLPIYAWAIEHPEGIIVVDTGETARTSETGYFTRWHPYFRLAVRTQVRPEDEIGPQLQSLGIRPRDVRWLVLTHLHTDHAGGLHHFPHSEILVTRTEYTNASGWRGQLNGFLPQHWPAWFAPRLIDFNDTPVGAFPHSYTLTQDVQLVPAAGHTPGQLAVIVSEGALSILIAGDISYTQQTMLDQTIDGVSPNPGAAAKTLARTLTYTQVQPTVYLPSHDPEAAARLAARRVVPAQVLIHSTTQVMQSA